MYNVRRINKKMEHKKRCIQACTFREDPDIESETQIKCITLCN
jgi:hypothetical protein